MSAGPQINATERQREHAVALAVGLDLILFIPYTYVSVSSMSWTMIAECLRFGLLLVVGIVSYLTMRRIHRGRMHHYEYGADKLEEGLSVVIALLLILTAGMLLWRISGLAPSPKLPPGLAAAAIALVFTNLAINCGQLYSLYRAHRHGGSVIVRAQYQARWVKAIASAIVAIPVTITMVADNRELATLADQIGTLVVIVIMVGSGISMIRQSLPDLLDRALPETLQQGINRVLARHIDDYEQLGEVRTRSAGNVMHVELELFMDPAKSMAEASAAANRLRHALAEELPGVHPVILLRAEGEPE